MKKMLMGAMLASALAAPAWAGGHACTVSVPECKEHMKAELAERGWLGVRMEPLEDGTLKVVEVIDGSPAQSAGLREGDVLLALDGAKFGQASEAELKKATGDWKPGTIHSYSILRDAKEVPVKVTLAEMPQSVRDEMIAMHVEAMHSGKVGFKELTVDDVAKLVKAGRVTLYDANSSETRAKSGVVPGAKLLASASSYELSSLPKEKDAPLVFYCANPRCTASDTAAKRAVENGWTHVAVMRPGIAGWVEAGQETTKPPSS